MAEVGFFRRIAPAVILATAGGVLLYLLPSGADSDLTSSEDIGAPEPVTGASSTSQPSSQTSSRTSSPASSAASAQRVVKGDAVDFKFGTVQVKVALDGSTITDIATITAPGGNYQRYSDYAIPDMKAKILAAQSTRVAAVSGATYTSEAYAQSVQSALDKA